MSEHANYKCILAKNGTKKYYYKGKIIKKVDVPKNILPSLVCEQKGKALVSERVKGFENVVAKKKTSIKKPRKVKKVSKESSEESSSIETPVKKKSPLGKKKSPPKRKPSSKRTPKKVFPKEITSIKAPLHIRYQVRYYIHSGDLELLTDNQSLYEQHEKEIEKLIIDDSQIYNNIADVFRVELRELDVTLENISVRTELDIVVTHEDGISTNIIAKVVKALEKIIKTGNKSEQWVEKATKDGISLFITPVPILLSIGTHEK